MARSKNRYAKPAAHLAGSIRNARTEVGMSQQQLAEKADISIGTVRNIEQGAVKDPGFFEVAALAYALGIELDILISKELHKVDASANTSE